MLPLLLMLGCAPKTFAQSLAEPERFRVALSARFHVEDPEGLPQPALAALAPTTVAVDLVVERVLAREFRDGSLGWALTFSEASARFGRDTPTEPLPLSLAGRTVELRTFPDGELLDVSLVEHIVGPGRLGDVLDVVFPAITPAPPPLRPGQSAGRAMHWPVRLNRDSVLLSSAWARWEAVDQTREQRQVRYAGPIEARGRDLIGEASATFEGSGSVSGDVWLGRRDEGLLRHVFEWERRLEARYPSGATFTQVQVYSGEVERL